MYKKILLPVVVFLFAAAAVAQSKKATKVPVPKSNPHLKVFNQAIASGDASTAVTALNYFIIEQGANTTYADTLAMMYMQQGAFSQCYYWANKRLQTNPENNTLLELKGISLDKMQQTKEAIDIFEQLFKKTQSPYHAYKLMELQYGIKRLSECLATAIAAEKLAFKPEYFMTYNVGQQTGRTYLQAGVFNIHALALYDLDRKAEAKIYFEKALALDSSFALAKQNIEAMNAAENTGTKNGAKGNSMPQASPANKQ